MFIYYLYKYGLKVGEICFTLYTELQRKRDIRIILEFIFFTFLLKSGTRSLFPVSKGRDPELYTRHIDKAVVCLRKFDWFPPELGFSLTPAIWKETLKE